MNRIASFCYANAEIVRYTAGKSEQLLVCSVHGKVPKVAYYPIYQNGFVARDPYWTCLQCFERHCDGTVVIARQKTDKICRLCSSDEDVKHCDTCGEAVCAGHRMESGQCYGCGEFAQYGNI